MDYSFHVLTDRIVNDRFGYYSKQDPLYQHFLEKKNKKINKLFYSSPAVSLLYNSEEMVSISFLVLSFLWISKIISN